MGGQLDREHPLLLAPWLLWKPTPVWEGLAVFCLSPPPNPYVEVGGGQVVCGGGASHTLPSGPPSSLRETFLVSKGAASRGKGNKERMWVLGSQSYHLHTFSHSILLEILARYLLVGPFCSRGNQGIAGRRQSLDGDAVLCVSTLFLRPSPTVGVLSLPCSPPAPRSSRSVLGC